MPQILHQYGYPGVDFPESPLASASSGIVRGVSPQSAISVVVKAPTAENAELAANQLARSLAFGSMWASRACKLMAPALLLNDGPMRCCSSRF
jgi:hypothetical protein